MDSLHQLRVFAAVVDEASFTGAATRLFLTQPAVSAQVRHLRETWGLPILARDGRRVVPTEAGTALYRYACEVLALTDSLHREFQEISSGVLDHIVVGGDHTHGVYVVPEVIAEFHDRYPGVAFTVLEGTSGEIISRVRSRQIDIGLISSTRVPQDLLVRCLGQHEPVIVDSVERPVSGTQTLDIKEFATMPFVRTRLGREPLSDPLDRLLVSRGLQPCNVVMEVSTWEGAKAAVRAGVGLAVVLPAVVREELSRGELRTIDVKGFRSRRSVNLICSPRRQSGALPPVFRDLLDFFEEEIPVRLGLTKAEAESRRLRT